MLIEWIRQHDKEFAHEMEDYYKSEEGRIFRGHEEY